MNREDENGDNGDDQAKARTNLAEYLWMAPRVIMKWIDARLRQGEWWRRWSIDVFDGMESFLEWILTVPEILRLDQELTSEQHKGMRRQLLQLELASHDAVSKGEDPSQQTKNHTLRSIRRIIMWYHYGATQQIREAHKKVEEQETIIGRLADANARMGKPECDGPAGPEICTPKDQAYRTKGWSTNQPSEGEKMINCMWQSNGSKSRADGRNSEEDIEGHLICTMRGQEWEPLP